MSYGSEGNRRSGIALAMRYRLQWFIQLFVHIRAQGLRKGDEHPAYTLLMGYGTLYLLLHAVAPYVLEDIFKAEKNRHF